MIKTYSELIQIPTFEGRFEYLKLNGIVGAETFGFDRYLNQTLYNSEKWKAIRNRVIIRDQGCDLGHPDHQIYGRVLIHHINPITMDDLVNLNSTVFDMENLICTMHSTHNAIHYGDAGQLIRMPAERKKNDTCPWKN